MDDNFFHHKIPLNPNFDFVPYELTLLTWGRQSTKQKLIFVLVGKTNIRELPFDFCN